MEIFTSANHPDPKKLGFFSPLFCFFGKITRFVTGRNVLVKGGSGCGGAEFKSNNSLLAQRPLKKILSYKYTNLTPLKWHVSCIAENHYITTAMGDFI